MEAKQVKTAADARRLVEQRNLGHVTIGVFDTDGILRSTCLSQQKFFSALDHGFELCSLVLGWDSNDQPYDNVTFTGRHTGYPDAQIRIRPATCRELPFEKSVLFLAEFAPPAAAICPRAILRRVLNIAHDMELTPFASFEYEFFLFAETAQSLLAKHYKDLQPLRPGRLGYSLLRSTPASEFQQALMALCEVMDYPLESLHKASGPGMLQAAISVDDAEAAADKAALFKAFTKVLAQRRDLLATFMAKWSADYPGCSGHIHLSLKDSDGNAPFYDPQQPHNISNDLRHFIGGQQQLMPQLLAMMAPTVNAYTRLLSGYPAPSVASWGIDNRTCALRLIPGDADSQRVEFRAAAADANPYIVLAATLAAGLWGMENKVEPETPVQGNAHEQTFSQTLALPTALWEATQNLKVSQMARDWFGDAFVDHFTATREWEAREFQKHISDWEISRYLEII
jgi:glutamine synthetase